MAWGDDVGGGLELYFGAECPVLEKKGHCSPIKWGEIAPQEFDVFSCWAAMLDIFRVDFIHEVTDVDSGDVGDNGGDTRWLTFQVPVSVLLLVGEDEGLTIDLATTCYICDLRVKLGIM